MNGLRNNRGASAAGRDAAKTLRFRGFFMRGEAALNSEKTLSTRVSGLTIQNGILIIDMFGIVCKNPGVDSIRRNPDGYKNDH